MPNYSKFNMSEYLAGGTQEFKIGNTTYLSTGPAGKRIGVFDQDQYRTKLAVKDGKILSSVSGAQLGGGFCNGVCLEWARRVLRRPGERSADSLTYRYEQLEANKKNPDVARQRKAYDTVHRMGVAYAEASKPLWTGESIKAPDWATLKQDISASANKSFAHLEMVGGKNSTYTSPGQWLGELVNPWITPPGTVARLGFKQEGQSGHAIAVWRRREATASSDSFYLFDPNFGVFAYSAEALQRALCVLWWKDAQGTDNADVPYYESCCSATAQVMSYIVMGPANRIDAPVQVAVQIQPSFQTVSNVKLAEKTAEQSPLSSSPKTPVPVNGYSNGNQSIVSPGLLSQKSPSNSVPTKTSAPVTSSGDLKSQLTKLLSDPTVKVPRVNGQLVTGGGVRVSQALATQIVAAKVPFKHGLTGTKPAGEIIAATWLEQIIGSL